MDWLWDHMFWPVFALIWIAVGVYLRYRSNRLLNYGVRTVGVIHDFADSSDKDGFSETPIVRYTSLEQGQEIIQKLNFSSNPRIHKRGQKVKIIYDPKDPTNISLDSSLLHTWVPLTFIVGGLLAAIYGIVLMYW